MLLLDKVVVGAGAATPEDAVEAGVQISGQEGTGFKGTTAKMNGKVFECYHEQTDRRQYTKTVKALKEYAQKNLKYAQTLLL